ncbi:hypothetical protein C5167_000742 [Papaver somniferum]|uniref:C3H1-type domain-containing protein n=1 Tax=Papaver somniferum TaxID=3469 RepID=A0A4Y7KTC1_PAPSO|nr:zinc finger CCCH domain-containing protein 2-like [Papaver somniferum]RZC76604.1 hypothetical protein C5167_000742 [Papaver somniferum]
MSSSMYAAENNHYKKLLGHHQGGIADLPPRKQLLTRRSSNLMIPNISFDDHDDDHFETVLLNFPHKFLPCNNTSDDDENDPYASDEFRIYEFKIRRCMRSRSHDWTDCPFAHPGEKARRRDPRRYHYSGNACSDFRRGNCLRGDSCEFSHGVFECWLHPTRYRTQVCKDGRNCKRKVCFFAHTPKQLRVLVPPRDSPRTKPHHHLCNCVYSHSSSSSPVSSSSPTSTLMGFSHLSLSPPLSPTISPSSSSELTPKQQQSLLGMLSYKSKLMELVNSLEAMDLSCINNDSPTAAAMINDNNFSWSGGNNNISSSSPNYENQEQFFMSPNSTTTESPRNNSGFKQRDYYNFSNNEDYGNGESSSSSCPPDLDWVNELVM